MPSASYHDFHHKKILCIGETYAKYIPAGIGRVNITVTHHGFYINNSESCKITEFFK